ncbi:hypothetical protein ACOME3_009373 [Neoechinorhynchus agilis]
MPNSDYHKRRWSSRSFLPSYLKSRIRRQCNRQKSLLAERSRMVPFGFEYSGLTYNLRLVSFNLLIYNKDRYGLESETIVMVGVAPRLSRLPKILQREMSFHRPTKTPFMRASQCLERMLIPKAVIEKPYDLKRKLKDSQDEGNLQDMTAKSRSKVVVFQRPRKANKNATNNSVIFSTMSSGFDIAYLEQLGQVHRNARPIKWVAYDKTLKKAVTTDFSQFAVPTELEVVANFASNSEAYKFMKILRSTGIDDYARLIRWRRRDEEAYEETH